MGHTAHLLAQLPALLPADPTPEQEAAVHVLAFGLADLSTIAQVAKLFTKKKG